MFKVNFKENHSNSYKKYFILSYLIESLFNDGINNNNKDNEYLHEFIIDYFDGDKIWYNLTDSEKKEIDDFLKIIEKRN